MQQENLSLSPRVLLFYVGHSLRVMTGKASMTDVYQTDAKGLWHAIWASMIFTAMVTIYPTLKNAPSIFMTTMIVQLVGLVLLALIFLFALKQLGLAERSFAFMLPFFWIENVQQLLVGLTQLTTVSSGNHAYLVLVLPIAIWTCYWLWRVGKDQLGKGGWVAAGIVGLSFATDVTLLWAVQTRLPMPAG